jgi:hypothetical protein
MMGKELALSTPGRVQADTGAPVFRHGSAASDDVHAILDSVPAITRLRTRKSGHQVKSDEARQRVLSQNR